MRFLAARNPDVLAVVLLVALSLALRLVALGSVPPNLTADEADNMLSALQVFARGDPSLFGLDWKPSPAWSAHVILWFTGLFGFTIPGLRMASVVLSTLAIVPFYFLARSQVGTLSAAAAALLLSSGLWFLHFSRSGWENVHVAFYAAMAAWLISLALRRGGPTAYFYFAGAGAFAALGLYGYFAGRLIVVGLLLYLPFALWQTHRRATVLAGYALALFVCAALFMPQIPALRAEWAAFNLRTDAVSIFNVRLPYMGQSTIEGVLGQQVWSTLRAFILMDGTAANNARYFPPQRPLFDWLTALLYLAGLAIAAARWRRTALWWCMLVVPIAATQLFSQRTPDFARAIGAAPFAYLFVAQALDALLRRRRRGALVGLGQLLVLVAVPLAAFSNVVAYRDWMAQPSAAQAREPAVDAADFGRWVELQTEELSAGRRGLNVMEWQRLRRRTNPAAAGALLPKRIVPQPIDLPSRTATLLGRFGGPTVDQGRLETPRGVAVAPDGTVFVADAGNRRVARFGADGRFGGALSGDFAEPFDLAFGPNGTLYVLDSERAVVKRFGPTGEQLGEIGGGLGMYHPRGLAVDGAGRVLIADTGRDRVVIIGDGGRLAGVIGEAKGLFEQPTAVAVDSDGNYYVASPTQERLVKLDARGSYLMEWHIDRANTVDAPHLQVSPDGFLVVSDPPGARLIAFGREGDAQWAISQLDEGKLLRPVGLTVDQQGRAFVADSAAGYVLKLDWR